jgi:hypothetical protein
VSYEYTLDGCEHTLNGRQEPSNGFEILFSLRLLKEMAEQEEVD